MVLPALDGTREARARHFASVMEGLFEGDPASVEPSPIPGGRRAALDALNAFHLPGYAEGRNHAAGRLPAVSRLSPYLRHGVLGLREVAEFIRTRYGRSADSLKFWSELGWRAFWRLLYARWGHGVFRPIEEPKVPLGSRPLPPEVLAGRTHLACMDQTIHDLTRTGMVHNHARMWFASWLIHGLKVDWREGERFFYRHLLDGDPASNALSWQWIASTFSHKPYFFNRANIEKFTDAVWCQQCPSRTRCPFEGSYAAVAQRWFGKNHIP